MELSTLDREEQRAQAGVPFEAQGKPVLLVAEGDDGVDFCGAAGWDPAGNAGYNENDDRCAEKRGWVVGLDAVELAGDYASQRESARGAQDYADGDGYEALADDHVENVGGRCAQRHADADFLDAARDGIGDHAVNADQGQRETDSSEDDEQDASQAFVADGFGNFSGHGHDVRYRLIGIGRPDLAGDCACEGIRVGERANHYVDRAVAAL